MILAGGASTRMGRDKAWLTVDGQPLIRRQIDLARDAGAAEVLLSGRLGVDYGPFGVPVVHDVIPGMGPLAGVARGLECARHALVLVLAVDVARMTAGILRRVHQLSREDCGVVPCVLGRMQPLVAFYPRSILGMVQRRLEKGQGTLREMIREGEEAGLLRCVELEASLAPAFANWNTREDVDALDG